MYILPNFTVQRKKEICSNAREVLEQIKKAFPHETYQTIAKRASVHIQTIQRWSSIGRAESFAIRRLISSLENEEILDAVLLKDASPAQLKKQCQTVGWDKVINA
jgi:acyl-CoA hydrolase